MRSLRVRLGPLAFAALLAAGAACARTPRRDQLVPIGGAWYFHLQSHLPEAGWVPVDLYRDWRGKPVLVASNIEDKRFYEPDCIVFVTGHATSTYVAYAACGDRQPVAIDVRDHRMWTLDRDGLRQAESARVESGRAVRGERAIPLEAIAEVAARQPPFEPGWRPADHGVVGALRPIERDVAVDDRTAIDERAEGGPGRTPLIDAAAGGAGTDDRRLALVDALISGGANVNATDKYGFTPLMMAASRGDLELVRRLLQAGASVNVRSSDGRTALMLASESLGQRIECVRLLREAGADPTIRDNDGQTAFERMRASRDPELLALLQ